MNLSKILMKPRLIVVLVLVLTTSSVMAFSLLEWLGFGEDEKADTIPAQETKTSNWAETSGTMAGDEEKTSAQAPASPASEIRFQDIKLIVANLNDQQRRELLSDEEAFRKFIQQQSANESVLAAARANKLDQEPLTRLLMQKSSENTLREIYLKRLINKELPPDFPTEEQSKTFYENNLEQFTLEERVHVWQIFLPLGQDADSKTRDALKKQLSKLKKDIDSGKVKFEDAATEHSSHIPSRHAGGYMGLIKLSDIKPEIRETVLNLKEGQLSEPVKSDDGYHLIRRGNRIAANTLSFEQAKPRINQVLRKEAVKRLRRAIYEQASKTYELGLDINRVEEWRLKLRTNL